METSWSCRANLTARHARRNRLSDWRLTRPAGWRTAGAMLMFLRQNAPWLAAGAVMTFGSSFGQTFFISVFAGEIRGTFGLSHGLWGGIYTAGTLASAALMLALGGLADRVRVRQMAMWTLASLALVAAAMAAVPAWWLLPVLIFGLRFGGQGMMGHLAAIGVGRWFRANRGRATAVMTVGVALGEASLPVLFVAIKTGLGWRLAWLVAAIWALALIPAVAALLRRERTPASGDAGLVDAPGLLGRHWDRPAALGHWLFWAALPGFLMQPLFGTTLFFQMVELSEVKGWPLAGFTALIPLFTGFGLAALFAAGLAIDRLGVRRAVPIMLMPAAVGYGVFAYGDALWTAALGFGLVGLTQGMVGAVAGTYWPEMYGTRHLGSIRALATSVMVFATALGPGLSGLLLDLRVGMEAQLLGMAILCVATSMGLAFAMGALGPHRAR